MRFRELTTETAGFYNTVGFNDDTPGLPLYSGSSRYGSARRLCIPRKVVAEHRLEEDEALEVAHDLAYRLVKKAYRL